MRELKFRAWDGKHMLLDVTIDGHSYTSAYRGWNDVEMGEEIDGPVMQYTGLKDKNGVEIYEGDIVKGFSGNGVVEWFTSLNWDSGGSAHAGFWCKEWCEYKDLGALSYHDTFEGCEVIGNIHENLELLK